MALLRREFVLDRPVARARLYATAQGVYEAELNGAAVSDVVLAWNDFLADCALRAGARAVRVRVVPTCIDADRYVPRARPRAAGEGLELVWIGSSSTLPGLEQTHVETSAREGQRRRRAADPPARYQYRFRQRSAPMRR